MCGICLSIVRNFGSTESSATERFSEWLEMVNLENGILRKRGPDSFKILSRIVESNGASYALNAAASVLHMRGDEIVAQPLENENGDFLLFNGELYGGLDLDLDVYTKINDGQILFEKLSKFSDEIQILRFVSNLRGPRTFIYFNNCAKKLYLSRDFLGRCSLLWNGDDLHTYFCSAKPPDFHEKWSEMPAGSLICVDFAKEISSLESKELCYKIQDAKDDVVKELTRKYVNVMSYELTLIRTLFEINENLSGIDEFPALVDDDPCKIMNQLLKFYEKEVDIFLKFLRKIVRQRLECLPRRRSYEQKSDGAKLAVLFSGGVDSLLLATVCDEIWPENEPIDLLNVAFEQSDEKFSVPDRQTGLKSLSEMKKLNEKRVWNFVQIDVTREELQTKRNEIIANLVNPSSTVLDDSIGCSLWFAARGRGTVDGRPYRSSARAIVVGSGADELLAGYSRHRQKFLHFGWSGLVDELKLELKRLPFRNLGRDDRVMADHGREPHAPYLDEVFVSYCNSLPIEIKANLNLPRGVGEKLILRLALWRLGFRKSALEPKRAMQFGTRIAKSENRKERGADLCCRLANKNF